MLLGTDLANCAASTPATLPNTMSSVSEFEPSRLAPWMPTLEHSPAEYRPGSGVAVLPSAQDAAHRVVHAGQHRNRRMRRIDAQELFGQLVDLRQALAQLRLAEVAQVQVHHLRRCGPSMVRALLLLVPERLAQAVARAELHDLVARLGFGGPEAVVLQVAIAVLVEQESAFAAAGLGEQQAGAAACRSGGTA